MDRRGVLAVVAVGIASACLSTLAQGQRRLWRIGYHSAGSARSNAGWLDAFRRGMADLGWSEARDYVIDARYADGEPEAIPRLGVELVATQPDILLTTAEASIFALARQTKTIPIVFAIAADPVGNGFAASLQRPGGNLTGLTALTPDLAAKRLELLKEVFPQSKHVLVLFDSSDPAGVTQIKGLEAAATRFNVKLTLREIRQASDIDAVLDKARRPPADSCVVVAAPLINIQGKAIAARLVQHRMPSITSNALHVEAGGLMAYAPAVPPNFRRAAVYVDKILKGTKPGDLAIEQPSKIDLVINLKTAKALGIAIPESLRSRADRVIE